MTTLTAQDEVVGIAADLIKIDTTNTGDTATSAGERRAAEYVAAKLDEVGIESTIYESEPGRATLMARIEGADPSRDGLVVHGHLDVVPAMAEDWKVDPFAAEIHDGCLWGRGAVDMKDMDAMILAIVREWARTNRKPSRDIVLAFFADEEAGGNLGSQYMVRHHPELFEGCTEAISEVGGFSMTVGGKRLYPIQTAEKGMAWARLRASGTAGHGSVLNTDNAVTTMAKTVAELGSVEFGIHVTATVREFLRVAGELTGTPVNLNDPYEIIDQLGPASKMIGATVRTTVNPTMLDAGYKANVVPGSAEAVIDARLLPGEDGAFLAELDKILGSKVTREWITYQPPLEAPFDAPIFNKMSAALLAEDPDAHIAPYMMSGGTDAKALSRLGIQGYGFSPLQLPDDFDFMSLFHGVDERVPLDALTFGVRVLDRFLSDC